MTSAWMRPDCSGIQGGCPGGLERARLGQPPALAGTCTAPVPVPGDSDVVSGNWESETSRIGPAPSLPRTRLHLPALQVKLAVRAPSRQWMERANPRARSLSAFDGERMIEPALIWLMERCREVESERCDEWLRSQTLFLLAAAVAFGLLLVGCVCCVLYARRARTSLWVPIRRKAPKRSIPGTGAFCSGFSARMSPQELGALFDGAGAIHTMERVLWCAQSLIAVVVRVPEYAGGYCDLWLYVSEKEALTAILSLGGDKSLPISAPLQLLKRMGVDDVRRLSHHWASPPWNEDDATPDDADSGDELRDGRSWQQVVNGERERHREHDNTGVWSKRHRFPDAVAESARSLH